MMDQQDYLLTVIELHGSIRFYCMNKDLSKIETFSAFLLLHEFLEELTRRVAVFCSLSFKENPDCFVVVFLCTNLAN